MIRLDKGERVVGVDRIDGLGDEDEDDVEGDIEDVEAGSADTTGEEE